MGATQESPPPSVPLRRDVPTSSLLTMIASSRLILRRAVREQGWLMFAFMRNNVVHTSNNEREGDACVGCYYSCRSLTCIHCCLQYDYDISFYRSPFHYACLKGAANILRMLLAHVQQSHQDNGKKVINAKDSSGQSALNISVSMCDRECCQILLAHEAKVDGQSKPRLIEVKNILYDFKD